MGDLPSFIVRRAPGGALAAPTYINAVRLTANTAVTITPPSGANIVSFTPKNKNVVFYVRYDGSAAAEPTGTISDGGGSEPNPDVRLLDGVDTFSIVSPTHKAIILMKFYADDSEAGGQNE